MALKDAQGLLDKLKGAYQKNDIKSANDLLAQLKLKLIQLPALPPVSQPSPTAQQELALARDVLEHAVLVAVKAKDEGAMERAFTQLKVYYADTRGQLPPSAQEHSLLGLNLLRLLVANRIAEFHTELELLPQEVLSTPSVAHALQLERWLMEGAFNKVLDASRTPPSDLHGSLMAQLATTVREEVASCSERAYAKLKLADAQKMLMFGSEKEAAAYASEHGWQVQGQYIIFGDNKGGDASAMAVDGAEGAATGAAAGKGIPPLTLINNTLVYAKELERIV
mmetsp:Transcript_23282/g.59504  ORF Transcript_23282/g.59504 Transcript_23282/m.59504 type:complete len:281 (-) Transcript_23282:193-1035(-)|eukprot:CAMPEP_0202868862 /NCGR_PEP_ID=MMETSP1391-20130828/11249_1 /ASSEMBLY_ACC=CAM_ASM_000867 /TAXON_ID=1034604 /ORGANISM="Chlamydomonas leiostraca, Strain SAG 11-49" /LENGTH=280 /DNA_ID=CAMNT_0049549079 /DNA_START=10 /DNA_END=852 /DNA_ORIENTATION=-